ncbi:hypothetical protein HAX54_050833 [Datura stramonium]|uniref:Uncharacterized protein n=1 Tax=Datura stramonium TaxID=4076 RepID=A0ABS8SWX3_DATST|nr:hypothetical protein [Datura stramonium]
MAQKCSKEKVVASLRQCTIRARMGEDAPMEDDNMPQQPPPRFGHRWITKALYRVGLDFEEPFDDDDATDVEQARVDSNLESDVDDGDD